MHEVEQSKISGVHPDSSFLSRLSSHRFARCLVTVQVTCDHAVSTVLVPGVKATQYEDLLIPQQDQVSFRDSLKSCHDGNGAYRKAELHAWSSSRTLMRPQRLLLP